MAQHEEPMDIDSSVCDFDDKENAFHHNNALPRTPCTEKGYEELDVSELNMKLRYSVTPAASPMSKSYAGNFENRTNESDNALDVVNANMTRSLNTTLNKNDTFNKPQKTLPLQTLPTDHSQVADGNRNVLQPIDTTLTDDNNITVTVSKPNDDENISLPSSSSSMTHTPEATTPTKEIPKIDGGSPIIRGLKSVLNMFRPSQSPIPGDEDIAKLETLSPPIVNSPDTSADNKNQSVSVSTPLVGKTKDPLTIKRSPNRDSLVFNEDLEKDLEWKDDSTILFSHEKIPIHKLFFQQSHTEHKRSLDFTKSVDNESENLNQGERLNATVEYMDISYNDSGIMDKTANQDFNKSGVTYPESDSEFLDCESTFTKNESFKSQDTNELNSTEDVLSDINDLVENNKVNASEETLNGSDVKSANLSTASIETTKRCDVSSEPILCGTEITKDNKNIPEELQEENLLQDNQTEDERKAANPEILEINGAVHAVSVKNNSNITHVINLDSSDVIKSNQALDNNASDIISAPVLDNVGVNSLSQIPLIVDPRVLLFNIPLNTEDDKKDEVLQTSLVVPVDISLVIGEVLKTSPADIPLPEDDDMPSLPVMNSELENISHTLDKIADEIPKINQHESSVSSIDFMSDQRLTESPTENSLSPEVQEVPVSGIYEYGVKSSENSKPQMGVALEESTVLGNVDVAGFVDKNVPIHVSIDDTKVENMLPSRKSVEITKDQDDLILKTEIGHTDAIGDNFNVPVSLESVFIEDTKVENMLPSPKSVEITKDQDELILKPEIGHTDAIWNNFNKPVSLESQSKSEVKKYPSNVENILHKEIEVQESMDINLAKIHAIADANRVPIITDGNLNGCAVEHRTSDNTDHEDLINVKTGKYESDFIFDTSDKVNNCVNFDPVLVSNVSETTEVNTLMTASNIEFIKQEVEAIVTNAVDLAIKKSSESTKVTLNLFEDTTEDDIGNIVIQSQAELQEHWEPIKHEPIKDFNGYSVTSNEEDANEQQVTLNQLSENKYSFIVKDNIPSSEMEGNFVQSSIPSIPNTPLELEISDSGNQAKGEGMHQESPVGDCEVVTSNSPLIDVNLINNDNTDTIVKKANETIEENLSDVTSLDIEKIEPVVTTDEEVTASENNSPFVLVAQESQDADEIKPDQSCDDMESPFLTDSKKDATPPSSPKIVSKGYNFNFDEIDDPFATKTKIRVSPGPDSSPNQSFEVIKKPELSKKVIDKNSRRKSQSDRRRSAVNNKKNNSTFAGTSTVKPNSIPATHTEPVVDKTETVKESESSDLNEIANGNQPLDKTEEIMDFTKNFENRSTAKSVVTVSNENKDTLSLEQSTYYSAGTSSDEATGIKSEIKIPDLDDPNLDPFTSKSKMRQSPTPENVSNPFVTRSRICQTPPPNVNNEHGFATNNIESSSKTPLNISKGSEIAVPTDLNIESRIQLPLNDYKNDEVENSVANITVNIENTQEIASKNTVETDVGNSVANITINIENTQEVVSKSTVKTDHLEDKESLQNISIMTNSSNNDKENTVREVNTEDEDTVEGPFLEEDDLQNEDNMSDFDSKNADVMKFSELTQEHGENPDGGELFIDAEAFEFLLNQNKANTVTDSGKESLFLKFDPLFAKRMSSDGVMAALKQVQVKQSTPIKDKKPHIPRDATFDVPPVACDATFDKFTSLPGPSGLNRTQEMDLNSTADESFDDLNVTVSKPMMVVNPAVNPVVTPRNKTITPVRSNRQSLTFTSPAIAVIDRLLSMSAGNNSLMAHDITVAEVHRDNEADLALTQLRELLADKEISVYNLRSETKELQNRLATLESQTKGLETISENRLKNINELKEKLDEKTRINKKMAQVVEEYERTIASLIAEKEQDKKRHAEERLQLIKERDEQTAHLASMEVSFSDLHSKYEKSKQIILGFKANEDAYKKSIKEFEENLAKMQNNYELLKQHATSKLNYANEELQKINRAHEAEVLKMNAMIKRKELHITSLEETLQQKTKANEELTAICDELINKVG